RSQVRTVHTRLTVVTPAAFSRRIRWFFENSVTLLLAAIQSPLRLALSCPAGWSGLTVEPLLVPVSNRLVTLWRVNSDGWMPSWAGNQAGCGDGRPLGRHAGTAVRSLVNPVKGLVEWWKQGREISAELREERRKEEAEQLRKKREF